MQPRGLTALHHLIITLRIAGDEDDLGAKPLPRILEELHGIRPATALLGIPQDHALRLNVVVDEA